MEEAITLTHDDTEAALPHQVEAPKAWGLTLPDPVAFTVTLPRWCPVDSDALVSLHWWSSLSAHLHVLLPRVEPQEKVHYRIDKALRNSLTLLRDIYGSSVSAAISVAGMESRANVPAVTDWEESRELGYWTMAVQVAFGLLAVRAAAKGKTDSVAAQIQDIVDLVFSAFADRLGDAQVYGMFIALCTGTLHGSVDEKLEQWKRAMAEASEGLPDGVPGVAEAIGEAHV